MSYIHTSCFNIENSVFFRHSSGSFTGFGGLNKKEDCFVIYRQSFRICEEKWCVARELEAENLNTVDMKFMFERAVPQRRRLVAGLSPRIPVFDPKPVHLRFVVDNVTLVQVFLQVLLFAIIIPYSLSC